MALFGGDPSRVTLGGLFDGGASAHLHQISPQGRGLYGGIIAQSGTALNGFIEMMQSMIGGGINASRIMHVGQKVKSGPIFDAFKMLTFKDNSAIAYSPEYAPYYPEGLQHRNMGGLHLVPPKFVQWELDLMKFIANC